MGRRIMAYVAGLVTGFLIILIARVVLLAYYPFPEDLTWFDSDDMQTYFAALPEKAFVMNMLSHLIGAFCAGLITALVSNRDRFTNGIISGAVIFVFIIISNFTFDVPSWFIMADTFVVAISAFSGAAFGKGRSA